MKGHQDKNTEFDDLSLLAQLNIEADKITGQFQIDHGNYLPRVTLLPSAPAILSIRGISIMRQYNYHLQRT